MELRHLRYFVEAAETKHFGRAAKRLNVVQSTLSMQIRDFEKYLGAELFMRVGKGVLLTNAGARLLPEARRILSSADQLKIHARRAVRGETGRLRIGYTSFAVATSRLTNDLRAFHLQHPEVNIQLFELSSEQQMKRLAQNTLDVGYAPGLTLKETDDYFAEPLATYSWSVVLPDDHPLADRQSILPQDLARETFVVCGHPTSAVEAAHVSTMSHLLGFEPFVVHVIEQSLTGLAMVAAGLGVSIVPEPLSQLAIPRLVFRPFDSAGGGLTLVLVTRKSGNLGPTKLYRDLSLAENFSKNT